jgi:hypothetical protein
MAAEIGAITGTWKRGASASAAWPKGPATVLEVEHCVVRPGLDTETVRARVVQTVALGKDESRLRGIKVFSEQCYGPYRNGDQLGGCALRESAFAAGERLAVSEVVGQWESAFACTASFSGALNTETVTVSQLNVPPPRTHVPRASSP